MSWHFLQGQEAASWGGTCLDGAPSVLSSLIPTPGMCCSTASAMDCCHGSRSGTTCEPSTASPGADGCRSCQAASHAPTSAQPGRAPGSMAQPAAYGWKWPASFVKYDPSSSSWRTRQCSLLGDSGEFSGTWPRWGSMRDGECWELQPLAHRTNGKESGSWPTPRANDGEKRGNFDTTNPRNGLPAAVKRYMTPTASIGTKNGGRHRGKADTLASQVAELEGMTQTSTGQLNPTWVEWLMGWPTGWTACDALAMDKFHEWRRMHGGC
jgi:hypothetical protein